MSAWGHGCGGSLPRGGNCGDPGKTCFECTRAAERRKVPAPTVHLNGTAKVDLLQQQLAVRDALAHAIAAVAHAAPHGRDYYPQGPDAYAAARRAHDARASALEVMLAEVAEVYVATRRQGRNPGGDL